MLENVVDDFERGFGCKGKKLVIHLHKSEYA